MNMRWSWLGAAAVLTAGATGYGVWQSNQPAPLSLGFASGNGRIEAVDIDIAAKIAGRVREILVDEGDMVQAGQTVARMDTDSLASELRQAQIWSATWWPQARPRSTARPGELSSSSPS